MADSSYNRHGEEAEVRLVRRFTVGHFVRRLYSRTVWRRSVPPAGAWAACIDGCGPRGGQDSAYEHAGPADVRQGARGSAGDRRCDATPTGYARPNCRGHRSAIETCAPQSERRRGWRRAPWDCVRAVGGCRRRREIAGEQRQAPATCWWRRCSRSGRGVARRTCHQPARPAMKSIPRHERQLDETLHEFRRWRRDREMSCRGSRIRRRSERPPGRNDRHDRTRATRQPPCACAETPAHHRHDGGPRLLAGGPIAAEIRAALMPTSPHSRGAGATCHAGDRARRRRRAFGRVPPADPSDLREGWRPGRSWRSARTSPRTRCAMNRAPQRRSGSPDHRPDAAAGPLAVRTVIDSIDPAKDIDGIHPRNAGLLSLGYDGFLPATPRPRSRS